MSIEGARGEKWKIPKTSNEQFVEIQNQTISSTGLKQHYLLGLSVANSYQDYYSGIYDRDSF